MADVVGAYLYGHQAGQAEKDHQTQLEENKLRAMVLKHQLDALKIDDESRKREILLGQRKFFEGQPAASIPSTPFQDPGIPSLGVNGMELPPVQSMEALTRQQILQKRSEQPAIVSHPGDVTLRTNIDTGALEPAYTNPNPKEPTTEFGQFQQIYAEGLGKKSFDELTAPQKAGVMPAYIKARQDPVLRDLAIATRQAALGQAGGANVPLGVSGEEALKGVPANVANTVRAVVEYRIPLPGGFALRSPYWQQVLSLATAFDPSFDSTQYTARQRLRTDFTSGKSAANIRSLNTVTGHLDTLQKAAEGLDNRSLQLWNMIANKGLTATGDPRVVKFNTAANAVESELATAFKGTGATDQEIKAWRAQLNSSQSPDQIRAAIAQAVDLMGSRLDAVKSQYDTGMGKPTDFKILTAKSEEILKRLSATQPAAPTPSAGVSVTSPSGKSYSFDSQEKADAFIAAAKAKGLWK